MKLKIPTLPFTREKAIEVYLKHGGVLKIKEDKLIYPDKLRIEHQLSLIEKKINYLTPRITELKKKKRELSLFNIANLFKTTSDSLFWKHHLRKLLDEAYRKVSKTVAPPVNRLNEERYRRIVEQFFENDEYRKSLFEAKTSIINDSTLAESIEKSIKESKKLLELRLNKLKREREVAFEKKKALETFLNWAD